MDTDKPIHVSLVVTPEVDASALAGLHGVLNAFAQVVPGSARFTTDIVLPNSAHAKTRVGGTIIDNVMGIAMSVQKLVTQVEQTDVLIMPSLYLFDDDWPRNPYPELTEWILAMHARGTLVCSACTAALLLAETGLLDGYPATQHWAFERLFRSRFPKVRLDIDKALIRTGASGRIVMSGASAAWHDLVIYVIAKYAGPRAAQMITKFFLLSMHSDGQAPYRMFMEDIDHGDGVVLSAQQWLRKHSAEPAPVERVLDTAGLHARTFNRRFHRVTGYTPIRYVQHLRIENAKEQLEMTRRPVDEISCDVGYEDPAFFRRLFKRLTGMAPSAYRRKFHCIAVNY